MLSPSSTSLTQIRRRCGHTLLSTMFKSCGFVLVGDTNITNNANTNNNNDDNKIGNKLPCMQLGNCAHCRRHGLCDTKADEHFLIKKECFNKKVIFLTSVVSLAILLNKFMHIFSTLSSCVSITGL